MRQVVPIRLGEGERRQIASAADRLSAFLRQAALQASAIVERKAEVKALEPERDEGLVMVEPEPSRHMVDGEWIVR